MFTGREQPIVDHPFASANSMRRGRSSAASMAKGIVLGAVATLAVIAVVAVIWLRDPIAPLDRAAFEAAHGRWKQHAPADYDLELTVEGDQTGRYEVEVRGSRVATLRRDGAEQPQRGDALRYWSVEGLFEVIEIDLEQAEKEQKAAPDVRCRLRLSAEFDSELGYPSRYRRLLLDSDRQVQWRITRLTPR
jgi:HAMP domain-containing protein